MRLNRQQIQMILLAVLLIGGGGWFYIFKLYQPMAKEIKSSKANLEQKRAELAALAYVKDELEKEKNDLEVKRLEFESVQDMLPREKEIPSLLESITQTAEDNTIDLLSFTPQALKPGEIYNEIPINMNIKANYHDLGRFLNEIGQLHRIVVPSIQSLTGKEATKEDPYTLSASLSLSTFVYKEGAVSGK